MVKTGVYMRSILACLTNEPQTVEDLKLQAGYMPNPQYLHMTLFRLRDAGLAKEVDHGKWVKAPTLEDPTKE